MTAPMRGPTFLILTALARAPSCPAGALVMNQDRRVRGGRSFDGPMRSQPPVTGLDRPFMLMTAQFTRAAEPSVEQFWSLLPGRRRSVQAGGALHGRPATTSGWSRNWRRSPG